MNQLEFFQSLCCVLCLCLINILCPCSPQFINILTVVWSSSVHWLKNPTPTSALYSLSICLGVPSGPRYSYIQSSAVASMRVTALFQSPPVVCRDAQGSLSPPQPSLKMPMPSTLSCPWMSLKSPRLRVPRMASGSLQKHGESILPNSGQHSDPKTQIMCLSLELNKISVLKNVMSPQLCCAP